MYTVAGGKSIPSWVSDKKKKSLKKDGEYRRRVELIQDFEFPAASQKIKVTPDEQYIFVTGYHPPRVRVYDVSQLSMKFERHLDAEIVDFQILTDDYSKVVFLCTDRTLNFHARFGGYYKTRIPKFGRDLAYCPFTAELLVASSSPEIYRLSLAEGRFLSPLNSRSPAVNVCGIAPSHGLLACGGEDGVLECFDPRQRESVGWLAAAGAMGGPRQGLTALRFDTNGMNIAVGTSGGLVALFDLRSQQPLLVKDHMYDSPIVDVKFHNGGGLCHESQCVISADKHIVKIWDATSGEIYTNIEPADGCDINDVAVWRDSGLIMAACDAPRIQAYFVPSLGAAPRWCTFLDSLTEELEENAIPTVYDDYRFITRNDLNALGLGNLLGTPLLRAYMHGFFVDNRLYQKAKAIADPFAYDVYRQKRITQKLEEERRSRISLVKRLPKVNAAVAARILAEQQEQQEEEVGGQGEIAVLVPKSKSKSKAPLPSLLEDDRFKAMFMDPAFAIDERSDEYRVLHPNVDPARESAKKLLEEHFEELENDQEDDVSDAEEDSSESEDEYAHRKQGSKDNKRLRVADKPDQPGRKAPRMFAAKDATAAAAFREGRSLATEREVPLGAKAAAFGGAQRPFRSGARGNREMSFVPRMAPDGKRGRGRSRGGASRGGGRGRSQGRGRGRGRR